MCARERSTRVAARNGESRGATVVGDGAAVFAVCAAGVVALAVVVGVVVSAAVVLLGLLST